MGMNKPITPPKRATVASQGWSVDQLVAYAKQHPDAILDVLHLSVSDLKMFRYMDPEARAGRFRDNAHLAKAQESGGMEVCRQAGQSEFINQIGAERIYNSRTGTSAGGLPAVYETLGIGYQAANAQMHLCGKGYKPDNPYHAYIDPFRKGPMLDLAYLGDTFRDKASLEGYTLPAPVHLVMTRRRESESGAISFYKEVVTLDDKSTAEEMHAAIVDTMRVPGVGHLNTQDDVRYDGAAVEAAPVQTAVDMGATHVEISRSTQENDIVQNSIVGRVFESVFGETMSISVHRKLYKFIQWKAGGSKLVDHHMIDAWLKANERRQTMQDIVDANPNVKISVFALPHKSRLPIVTDKAYIWKSRIASYELEKRQWAERGLDVSKIPVPQTWYEHGAHKILGIESIDPAAIYEEMANEKAPTFDPANPAHRNDHRYQARMDKLMRDMMTSPTPERSGSWMEWEKDGLGLTV